MVVLGDFGRQQAGGVVARALDGAGAERSRAVVVVDHPGVHRFDAALVIRADRHGHDDEFIFVARRHADGGAGAERDRADIHGAAGAVGGHVVDVVADDFFHGFDVNFFREFGHQQVAHRGILPARVFNRAENPDLAILAHKGFLSFKARLSVVEYLRGDGHGDVVVAVQFSFAPLSVLEIKTDVRAGLDESESQFGPLDVHNSKSPVK